MEVASKNRTVIVNGLSCSYRQEGRGTPLILLHGWAQSSKTWKNVLASLGEEYAVYAIDLPGCGRSDAPTHAWTIGEYADFVHAFVLALSLDHISLLGHSFGARIAASYASHFPARKLILYGAGGAVNYSIFRTFNAFFVRLLRPLVPNALYRAHTSLLTPPGYADTSNIETGRSKMMLDTYLTTHMRDAALFEHITCPTLLIYGTWDLIARPQNGIRIQKKIPGAQLVYIPRAGHFAHIKKMTAFLEVIRSFLRN